MMYHPKILVPPQVEPVSLAEAQEWTRLSSTAEINTLTSILLGAREYIENDLGYTFFETTLEFAWDRWPCDRVIALPRATPLQSVTSVTYVDQDGTPTVLDTSMYRLDTYSTPGRIYLPRNESWPPVLLDEFNGVRIKYIAGKTVASPEEPPVPFPEIIKMAIRLLVGHWNENREATSIGTLMENKEIAYGVGTCLQRYRDSVGF